MKKGREFLSDEERLVPCPKSIPAPIPGKTTYGGANVIARREFRGTPKASNKPETPVPHVRIDAGQPTWMCMVVLDAPMVRLLPLDACRIPT